MSVFGRRVTPEQLASELLRGLESGEVAFDEDATASRVAERAALLLADRAAKLVEAKIAPLCAQLQALVDQAMTVLNRIEDARRIEKGKDLESVKEELGRGVERLEIR